MKLGLIVNKFYINKKYMYLVFSILKNKRESIVK